MRTRFRLYRFRSVGYGICRALVVAVFVHAFWTLTHMVTTK